MTRDSQISRRALIASATMAIALSGRRAAAQQGTDVNETLQFLGTRDSMQLLLNHFWLAYSLSENLNALINGANSPDSDKLGQFVRPNDGDNAGEFIVLVRSLAEPNGASERAGIAQALQASDPLSNDALAASHNRLVNQFKSQLAEAGINPESDLIGPATSSLTHMERIAAATVNTDSDESYFCRVFPFRWLCS